jgi:hypothetical protein
MTVSIEIPQDAEALLRQAFGSRLNRAALESLAVEGYREGRLSRFEVQRILGFDNRWEVEEWLGGHGANVRYSTADLEADRRTLHEMLGPEKS